MSRPNRLHHNQLWGALYRLQDKLEWDCGPVDDLNLVYGLQDKFRSGGYPTDEEMDKLSELYLRVFEKKIQNHGNEARQSEQQTTR